MKTITIPCHYKYEEEYLPPRCRKFRYRETEAVHSINIPVVAPKDAPIAFKHLDHIVGVTPDSGSRYYGSVKVYRVFNGKLYKQGLWGGSFLSPPCKPLSQQHSS